MIYPSFLKENDLIGICAPSSGVGDDLASFDASLNNLKARGYRIKETKSVRVDDPRSACARQRAEEFKELVEDDEVKLIAFSSGGDYMLEMMDKVDFQLLSKHPKWLMGGSDPTNLTYTITTNCDIASFYGFNAGNFYDLKKDKRIALDYLSGKLTKQNSYSRYISFLDKINGHNNYQPVYYRCKENICIKGRCLGGCFDVIEKLIGTPIDKTSEFIERYKDDGIVWYFDIFSLSSYQFYLSLLQMKMAGYFKYCKGVMIGRVAIPCVENIQLDYIKATDLALEGIPHICEMDIGHSYPSMFMINGALIEVNCKDGKGSIKFKCK